MKAPTLGAVVLVCSLASLPAARAQQTPPRTVPSKGEAVAMRAHAEIAGDGITGTADFVEYVVGTGREVGITVKAKGLKPGLHGVHLHAIGKCEPPAFTAAGGHFDPGPFGNTDPDANHPFHMGDLPNLTAGDERDGHPESADDSRHADGRTAHRLRRGRHGAHHSRQPRPGRDR